MTTLPFWPTQLFIIVSSTRKPVDMPPCMCNSCNYPWESSPEKEIATAFFIKAAHWAPLPAPFLRSVGLFRASTSLPSLSTDSVFGNPGDVLTLEHMPSLKFGTLGTAMTGPSSSVTFKVICEVATIVSDSRTPLVPNSFVLPTLPTLLTCTPS